MLKEDEWKNKNEKKNKEEDEKEKKKRRSDNDKGVALVCMSDGGDSLNMVTIKVGEGGKREKERRKTWVRIRDTIVDMTTVVVEVQRERKKRKKRKGRKKLKKNTKRWRKKRHNLNKYP